MGRKYTSSSNTIILLCNLLKCDNQRDFLVLMSGLTGGAHNQSQIYKLCNAVVVHVIVYCYVLLVV